MSRTKITDPQALAIAAADLYFAALAADLPYDTAPGNVKLVDHCNEIQTAIQRKAQLEHPDRPEDAEDAAMRAGYLLGVEIGRRMGGCVR